MPNYLVKGGQRRVFNAAATTALKPVTKGSRLLAPSVVAGDPDILVSSGRPGMGSISVRQFNALNSLAAFALSNTGDAFMWSHPAYSGGGALKGYVTKSRYGVGRMGVEVGPLTSLTTGTDGTVYDGRVITYDHFAILTDNTESLVGSQTPMAQPGRAWTDLAATFSITAGGTYSGNYRVTVNGVDAITINTSLPVIFQNMRIVARNGNGITGFNNNTTVTGCRIWLQNPGGTGLQNGKGINLEQFKTANIQHNYIEDAGTAIQIKTYTGNTTTETAIVLYNRIRNVMGQKTDGAGGYQIPPTTGIPSADLTFDRCQAIMFTQNTNVPGGEIAWNRVDNEPEYSRSEDNFNFYSSTAQAALPLLCHDNLINGAYPYRPRQTSGAGSTVNYTGGGILATDAAGNYIRSYNNVIVNASHYGIALLNGIGNWQNGNRIHTSPFLFDGSRNYASNSNSNPILMYNDNPSSPFNTCQLQNNVYGFQYTTTGADTIDIAPYIVLGTDPPLNVATNNTKVAGNVTLATIATEMTLWRDRILAAGFYAGP